MNQLDDLVSDLERAWNAGDGAAFGAAFTDDADFVDIRGAHHRGAGAIGQGHQAIFDSIYAGSKVRYEVASAAALADGCVLGIVHGTLDAPAGPLQGTHRSTISIVLVDDGAGHWRARSFHNTLVVEDGPPQPRER